MSFSPEIKPGETIDNQELVDIFKCSPQGEMRRSHKTKTLVIVSDKTKPFYEDVWKGDVIHYTGMGQTGDQSLSFMQNKTLAESNENGVQVHLFEVFEPKQYVYRGQVKLVGNPYQALQKDHQGTSRKVWLFPLKIIDDDVPIPFETFLKNQELKEKIVKKTTEELIELVRETNEPPQQRITTANQYVRDPVVTELAKRRANGICQLCKQNAPFRDKNGDPYLETHHIQWLSRGGRDRIDNTVALCPNCHRKMHALDRKQDVDYLTEKIKK